MSDESELADRLNRAIDKLETWAQDRVDLSSEASKKALEELQQARHNDLADLNNLRQEVRNLIEEIKND